MKTLVLTLCLLQSFAAFSSDSKDKKMDMSSLGKIDEETLKAHEAKDVDTLAKPETVKFNMSCKDSFGKEFKKGDVGYEICLNGIKSNHDLNKNKDASKNGNNANFNIKIGD